MQESQAVHQRKSGIYNDYRIDWWPIGILLDRRLKQWLRDKIFELI
jgi:hypothetical protein